jgi:hypothetical protein
MLTITYAYIFDSSIQAIRFHIILALSDAFIHLIGVLIGVEVILVDVHRSVCVAESSVFSTSEFYWLPGILVRVVDLNPFLLLSAS